MFSHWLEGNMTDERVKLGHMVVPALIGGRSLSIVYFIYLVMESDSGPRTYLEKWICLERTPPHYWLETTAVKIAASALSFTVIGERWPCWAGALQCNSFFCLELWHWRGGDNSFYSALWMLFSLPPIYFSVSNTHVSNSSWAVKCQVQHLSNMEASK